MSLGNFKIRVTRRRGNVIVTRLKRLASGSYVPAVKTTFVNRDLGKDKLTLVELVDVGLLLPDEQDVE